MKKLQLGVQGAAKMNAITSVGTLLGVLILMLIPCDQVKLAGHVTDTGM